MKKITLYEVILNALIAAIYILFVFLFTYSSFEAIQFRIAEALLVLVLFNKRLAPGLILGTFIANFLSPLGIIDAAFGTIASMLAITLMIIFRKKPILSLLFPAITNAFIVGFMITFIYETPYLLNFLFVFIGEALVLYSAGLILYFSINKNEAFKELLTKEKQS